MKTLSKYWLQITLLVALLFSASGSLHAYSVEEVGLKPEANITESLIAAKKLSKNNSTKLYQEIGKSPELAEFLVKHEEKGVKAWKFAFNCPVGVRTNPTILENLSNAITKGASNTLPTSSLTEITETTISHILRGNPIGHGNPTGGFHHITALIKRTDVKLINVTPVGTHGCYKAKLKFPNGNKPPKDFFPDNWDEIKVIQEIESAFPNKVLRPDLGSNTFTSVTDSGVPVYIQMNNGKIKSAFPFYE